MTRLKISTPDEGWVVIEGGHYLLIPYGAERDENGGLWSERPCHLCDRRRCIP